MIEQHPSDLGHVLTYHLIPTALVVASVYGVILLMFRFVARRGRGRGLEKVDGLNRETRRRERSVRRRRR